MSYIRGVSITRRTAIRRLALISAGAALLPSCLQDESGKAGRYRNFTVDKDQERLLEELTVTLIPSSDTPGAKEIAAHLFVWKMLDDCAPPGDSAKFLRGMHLFDAAARQMGGKSFALLEPGARERLLQAIESGKLPDGDLKFFYSTAKRLTILAYSSSQYFLTRVQVYELVPGRWHGCVPVQAKEKKAS